MPPAPADDQAQTDYSVARAMMVECQVRPNKVTDPQVIAAMRHLPRERFVPADRAALAYSDEDVALGGGRYLMEPMVIARLAQLAACRKGERALVVGAGSGYSAALLAACGASVVALEDDPALLGVARAVLASLAPGITIVAGDLASGWAATAPYDVILIDGATGEIPDAIAHQLRPATGRLLGVLKPEGGRIGRAVLCTTAGGGRLSQQPVFDCAVPALPMLARAAGFVF